MVEKPIVLFLCTGNSCRSQMAEALLRARAGDRFQALSAGTEPKSEIHPLTFQVMEEIGVGMDGQYPKSLDLYLGHAPVRHVLIVCGGANESCPRTFPGVLTRTFWPLDDPATAEGTLEQKLAKFRTVRDEIDSRLQTWLAETVPAL